MSPPSCSVCAAFLPAKLPILLSSYTVHRQDTGYPLLQVFHGCTYVSPLHNLWPDQSMWWGLSLSLSPTAPMPGNSPLPIYNPSLVPRTANQMPLQMTTLCFI
jgi:hypothetical protein